MAGHYQAEESLWLQISAGRGPAECALGVRRLKDYLVEAGRAQGVTVDMIDSQPGPQKGTLNSVLLSITDKRADNKRAEDFAQSFQGSIQWICKSPFRPHHRRKNWFVQVSILSVPEVSGRSQLQAADIHWETLKAGGPGGQHVNKTESAVRVVYRPSGITVLAREERSQHRNKKLALARLAEKLAEREAEAGRVLTQSYWQKHLSIKRGDPVVVFEGLKFRLRQKKGGTG